MKYKIVYDKGTRLRVRSGKYAFTKEEGYGLKELLLSHNFIDDVKTSYRNGNILIYYKDINNKKEVLDILNNIGLSDLFEGTPFNKDIIRDLSNDFLMKLFKTVIKRYLFKIILPNPIRKIMLFYRAIPFIYRGIDNLLSFNANVSLLDGVAIGGALYKKEYKTAGSVMFLLSITDMLEKYTMQKTKNTLKESLNLNVDTVWLVTENENNETIEISYPMSKLSKGDKIKIRMGSIIPVDGSIVEGEAMINESSMTGEPLAIHKDVGKAVHAGTILEEGSIVIEVFSVNDDTRLNKIINMIESSEELKAGAQSKAENLADSIVPYSLLATILTYLITKNSTKALSVLMVDFSCAIRLATPLSIISAMREASDNRIMVKGGKFLENYANADTIVFDKTGTLTNASPKVAKVIPCGSYSREEVLKISACIEEHFAHSVARAIVKQAEEENLHHEEEHSEVEYIVAHGIATKYKNQKAVIGSRHFIVDDEKVKFTKKQQKIAEDSMDKYSVIYLAIGGKLEGILCIDDPVRDEAKEVINELKKLGISNVIMLTGDSENAAKTIANELGINKYKSQILPEDKASIIEDLKNEGKKVIMVGDGINDSPALSTAHVSVAMRNSSDIAREVADISLLSDDLYDLITLRYLSKGMLDRINNNYHAIVGINGTLILLGILGIISPSISSLIHNSSTMAIGALSTRPFLNDDFNSVVSESSK